MKVKLFWKNNPVAVGLKNARALEDENQCGSWAKNGKRWSFLGSKSLAISQFGLYTRRDFPFLANERSFHDPRRPSLPLHLAQR